MDNVEHNLISSLKEIIAEEVQIPICDEPRQLVLKEDDDDSIIHKLTISFVPDGAIAFTLDYKPSSSGSKKRSGNKYQQLSSYFNISTSGINKSCDLVVVWPDRTNCNKYKVLLFDLKSEHKPAQEDYLQLDNSLNFIAFILSEVNLHYHISCNNIEVIKTFGKVKSRKKKPTYKATVHRSKKANDNTDNDYYIALIKHEKDQRDHYIGFSELTPEFSFIPIHKALKFQL